MKPGLVATIVFTAGCTHYVTTPMYGAKQEVGRTLVGSPQIEEVTSSNMSAGFGVGGASSSYGGYSNGFASGGLAGQSGTVKRTHCVQQAQVDFVQPVNYESHVEHRALDVAGSITLALVGAIVISGAQNSYNNDLEFYNMDPSFFAKPSQPTAAYAVGGAMIAGAGAWLIYSLSSLPKGPPPMAPPQQNRWTETAYVEAQGCGLVPADRPVAAQPLPSP